MSKLVRCCCMFLRGKGPFRLAFLMCGLFLAVGIAHGQDNRKVPISFLPPPLENATYSLGIYEAKSGKLVRRLQEIAPESAFTVGLNGLITSWDGKNDAGKAVPPGRYAARGYAVGALKIQGEGGSGNDWTGDDGGMRVKRVEAITALPDHLGLGILAEVVAGPPRVAYYGGPKCRWQWQKPLPGPSTAKSSAIQPAYSLASSGDALIVREGSLVFGYQVRDGVQKAVDTPQGEVLANQSSGKDGTLWKIEEGELFQYSPDGEKLRHLRAASGEPVPIAVAASTTDDEIYLLEEVPGWQRVRGLSWVETKEENGKPVSTWQTFFEREIRPPDPALGLENPPVPIQISLVENPLSPGKLPKIKLTASFDDKGSYLTTADGLHLRQIGQLTNLKAAKLTGGTTADKLALFQSDGAAWDEFSIEGAKNMMEFDAGEFEMTADGEKTPAAKPAEPPDL